MEEISEMLIFSKEKNQFLSSNIHQEQEVNTPHKTNYYGGSSIHISYEINAKHSLQWSTQLYYNTTSVKEHNTNQFYNQNNNNNQVVENSNNFNYTYSTNKKGDKLEIFLNYTYYHNTISNTTNIYKGIQAMPTVFTQSLLQNVPRYIYSYYIAGQYLHIINERHSLQGEFKGYYTYTDNDIQFQQKINTDSPYVPYPQFTNHFIYKEPMYSFFLVHNGNWNNRFQSVIGLKIDRTQQIAQVLRGNVRMHRNFLFFLPTISLNYNISKSHILNYSFNNSVRKPNI